MGSFSIPGQILILTTNVGIQYRRQTRFLSGIWAKPFFVPYPLRNRHKIQFLIWVWKMISAHFDDQMDVLKFHCPLLIFFLRVDLV